MTRAAVRMEDGTVVPADVGDLRAFRRWARSREFPERGRIDYLDAEGFQQTRVLARRIRLRREPWVLPGMWRYLLDAQRR